MMKKKEKNIFAMLMLERHDKLIISTPPIHTSTPANIGAPVNVDFAAVGNPANVASRNSVAPYNWNIFYTGSNSNELVNSFLEKLESLSESRVVSKSELFVDGGDLFKGPAWTWFLNNHLRVNNWDELVENLKEIFIHTSTKKIYSTNPGQ